MFLGVNYVLNVLSNLLIGFALVMMLDIKLKKVPKL